MSFANKFLGVGTTNVSDGTVPLYGSKIGASNLISGSFDTVKINGAGELYAAQLTGDDVVGVVTNPMNLDLDLNDNDILNAKTVEISNGSSSFTFNYNSGITNIDFDLELLNQIDDATQNINVSTTSGQTDFDGDLTISGDLQLGGSLIGDLNVTVSNFPAIQPISTTQTINVSTGLTEISIDNFPGIQEISTTQTINVDTHLTEIGINNFPSIQEISTTQTISVDTHLTQIDISNFPATQVISGIVTANAGSNLNTSLLALESGNISTINSKLNTLGQKAAAGCVPTVLSSGYESTCFVATDGGEYVLCGLDAGLVTGNLPINVLQLGSTNISRNSGTADTGTQRVVLTSDYLSTAIQRPFTSSMNFERKVITGNLANVYLANITLPYDEWKGTGNPIYLTELTLHIFTDGGMKFKGWGTVVTSLTGGFYVEYKRNSSATALALMGSSFDPIQNFHSVIRESSRYIVNDMASGSINAIMDFKDNPLIIENDTVGTRGRIQISFINPTDTTSGNVTEMYLVASYYFT